MTREDEDEFLKFMKTTGTIQLLPYASATRDFHPVQALPDPFSGKFSGGFWLFNPGVSSNLVMEFVPSQNHFTINPLQSSVVEFSRSGVKEKTLYAGRIWAEFTYLDSENRTLVPKEVRFSEWYDTLAKWIRGSYKRLERLIYAGPGAQKLAEEGFILK